MEIRLEQIAKSFDKKQVIQPTTLTIQNGSFTTLLGPSGCGKTTLLRMIAGLETPDAGEIYFDGCCVFSREKKINLAPEKRGLGFVFQDFALWPHMTVFENVAFGLRARRDTKDLQARVREALRIVHLEDFEARYPHQLSGGQQQRVAFARAVVIQPSCILFDEPLSALDALLVLAACAGCTEKCAGAAAGRRAVLRRLFRFRPAIKSAGAAQTGRRISHCWRQRCYNRDAGARLLQRGTAAGGKGGASSLSRSPE